MQLKADRRRLVAAGMYRDPQVTLQLTESPNQVATVTGELHSVVPVVGQRRLFDVLATAGGLPATASHMVTIQRPVIDQPIVVDLGTAFAMSFGAYSWVCARASVAPGVDVEEGAVLGLGSVATRNLEAWTVYAGVPAVKIKQRRRSNDATSSDQSTHS